MRNLLPIHMISGDYSFVLYCPKAVKVFKKFKKAVTGNLNWWVNKKQEIIVHYALIIVKVDVNYMNKKKHILLVRNKKKH